MALPPVGGPAPALTLPSLDGRTRTLPPASPTGATLMAFFKVSCPTCRLLFPFLARYHRRYAGPELAFLGVSQDEPAETDAFLVQAGASFPVVLDAEEAGFPASTAYGLVAVPSLVLVDATGTVSATTTGFVRKELEALADRLGGMTGRPRDPLWREGEEIPSLKPG